MTTNQNQRSHLDPLLKRGFSVLLGVIMVVAGWGQNDTIQVCPQSEFIVLSNGFTYNYIEANESEYLSQVVSFGLNSYFILESSWAGVGTDFNWQVGTNSGNPVIVKQASPSVCDVSPTQDPAFVFEVDCDSTSTYFSATNPDNTFFWDNALLVSVALDSTLIFSNTTSGETATDFNEVIPAGSDTSGAIFNVIWIDDLNGTQLNIISVVDTLMFPQAMLLGDTIYACRQSEDSVAQFNLFEIFDFYNLSYDEVTIYETDSLTGIVLPDDGYASNTQDTLYFLLENVNPNCPADTALVELLIHEYPEFLPLSQTAICAGEIVPFDLVNGVLPWVIEYNGSTIDVINETIQFDPVLEADTITSLTITDDLGCINNLNLQDTIFLHPVPAFVLLDDSICVGAPIEITVTGGPLTVFFTDSDSLNFSDIVNESLIISTAPVQGGLITIIEMENAFCAAVDDYSIWVEELPVYSLLDSLICGSNGLATVNETLLDDFTLYNSDVTASWSFVDDSPFEDSLFNASIDLILELENLTGCISQDAVSLFVFESPVVLLWDDTLSTCQGDTIELSAIIPSIEVSYFDSLETQWTVQDANGDIVPTSQVYFNPDLGLSITDGDWESPLLISVWTDPPHPSCDQVADSAYFTLSPLPEYTLIGGACAGEGMFLEFESIEGADSVSYSWAGENPVTIVAGSPIPTNPFEMGPTVELGLQLTSSEGCVLNSLESIQIFPIPTINSITISNNPELILCENDSEIPFQASPSSHSAYFWGISGNGFSSTDQDLNSEFLINVLQNTESENLTLTAHDSIFFMNNTFVCISEEYEYPLAVAGERCEIKEIYQFPGGLFVLEVENTDPDELNFVEWTIAGEDPILAGAFVYLPEILTAPDAELEVTTSLYGPAICSCQGTVETFGLIADLEKSISTFPNPVIGVEVNVLLPSPFIEKSADFRLYAANGDLIFNKRQMVAQPLTKLILPNDLHGVFVLEVAADSFVIRSKMMVE